MSTIDGQSVKIYSVKVKKSANYRKSLWRLVLLILAVAVVLLGFWYLSNNSGSYESRTSTWTEVTEEDYQLSYKYPYQWQSVTTGLTTSLDPSDNNDKGMIIRVQANPKKLDAQSYVDQLGVPEGAVVSDITLMSTQTAKQIDEQESSTVYLVENGRIYTFETSGDQQLRQDLISSISITSVEIIENEASSRMLTLTDVAFKELYNSLDLPGTVRIAEKPVITGDSAADAHIQMLAEARGYRLQLDATVGLGSADGFALQTSAAQAWAKLQTAAANAGIGLSVTSGFRDIATQQQIFTSRLAVACAEAYGSNCTSEQISSGQADQAIDEVLKTSSVPGYSRHHSGYTVDIGQDGVGAFEDFYGTPGWDWISADNYFNAKRFGFIPSYPPNAGLQGPDPEPWEFVYTNSPEFFRVGE